MEALAWIELSPLSVWLRESPSVFAFPTVLTLHTVGLAFLAGPSAAIALRILGVAPGLPLQPLRRLFPLMWTGFWINAATGTALLAAYPAKALTNPMFYGKLALIGLALWSLNGLVREIGGEGAGSASRRARRLAAASLTFWASAIVSGRLLAYTYSRLLTQLDLP